MARIACIGQIGIAGRERGAIFGLDCAAERLERLLSDGGDHVRERYVALKRVGAPEPAEGAFEVSELVGCKVPSSGLLGAPEPLVPGLYRCNHHVAEAR